MHHLLLSIIYSPFLSDNGDFDLSRILQALFDLLSDILGQREDAQVIHFIGLYNDAYLASSLYGIGFLDASERTRQVFKRLDSFEVAF